ncbi:MAG: ATP-dependent DNA helicase UvrD2 [Propionicimonas sp.]|nr:ATP-dependent DNA helicase UvrD2 [Propionicimonas sp.]
MDPEQLLAGLDPEQAEVATTFGRPVGVIAGAGTGKTRALTHRIAYGAHTGAYDPAAVLAVTFTTRAAGELRSRLRQLEVPQVQARTFHSAALRQAQYFWPKAFGTELPPVSEARLPLVAEAAHRLRLRPEAGTLRDLLTEVSWAKVANVAPAEYAAVALEAGREVAGLDPAWVGRVLGRYEQVKSERGVIDFDDILLCATVLLGDHPGIAAEVRSTYRHLLIDEYQDVSPVQHRLLELWRGDSEDLCVVGDPAQTIHSFAGASPQYLTSFGARFPAAAVIRLVRDYRSTPEIVGLANAVSVRARIAGGVRLESQQESGPAPRVLPCAAEADEAQAVVSWLQDLHGQGVPWRELAVLYRVHAQSPVFETALSEAGIGFTVRGGDGFFERAEVRQVLGQLTEAARRDPTVPAVDATRAALARLGWTTTAPAGQGRVRERWESLAALLALAEDLVAGTPGAELGSLVEELGARAFAEHAPVGDGVALSTLHAAKGLEWEAVAIVGVQEGTLPLSLAATPEQVAEEGRLFYVGVTRARRHLLVTWSGSRRGGGSRQPSRFLDGVGDVPRPVLQSRVPREKPRSALAAHCRVCGGALHTGAERKLERHTSCAPSYDEVTFDRLLQWRREVARERSVPAFVIFTDATLTAIAERSPGSLSELLTIPGVGNAKAQQYGPAMLAILTGEEPPAG